jgi:hypothetical protein
MVEVPTFLALRPCPEEDLAQFDEKVIYPGINCIEYCIAVYFIVIRFSVQYKMRN